MELELLDRLISNQEQIEILLENILQHAESLDTSLSEILLSLYEYQFLLSYQLERAIATTSVMPMLIGFITAILLIILVSTSFKR